MEYLSIDMDSVPEIILAHYFSSPEYDTGWRKAQGIEIILADKCSWQIEIMDRKFVQEPKQLCTLPLSVPHRVKTQSSKDSRSAHFALHFFFRGSCSILSGDEFSQHVSDLMCRNTDVQSIYNNKLFLPLHSDNEENIRLLPLFKEIIKEWSGKDIYSKYSASVTLQKMLISISRSCINEITGALEKQNRNTKETVSRTILFISENFEKIESIRDVADHLNLNPSYLGSVFKSRMGVSMINYLNSLRVDRAKIFMHDTDLSFREIGERVGVSNPYYFSSLFKKHTGVTMSEYSKVI